MLALFLHVDDDEDDNDAGKQVELVNVGELYEVNIGDDCCLLQYI